MKTHPACHNAILMFCVAIWIWMRSLNSLSANPTKWPITLKQFVGKLPTNCLSVFGHFVKKNYWSHGFENCKWINELNELYKLNKRIMNYCSLLSLIVRYKIDVGPIYVLSWSCLSLGKNTWKIAQKFWNCPLT